MDEASSHALRRCIEVCIAVYGADETRAISAEVRARIDAMGFGGALMRDWLIAYKYVSLERNPWSKPMWDRLNIEKDANARTH